MTILRNALIFGVGGAAIAAGMAFMALPVFAPGALLLAANMGMGAGLTAAGTGYCFRKLFGRSEEDHFGHFMGAFVGVFATLGAAITSGYFSSNSYEIPLAESLKKTAQLRFGNEFESAREGDVLQANVSFLGGITQPVIAKVQDNPQLTIYAAGDAGILNVQSCIKFNVASKGGDHQTPHLLEICEARPLSQDEIRRILPAFK